LTHRSSERQRLSRAFGTKKEAATRNNSAVRLSDAFGEYRANGGLKMALSDLAVFSEYTYEAITEVLSQQVELFNAASAWNDHPSRCGESGRLQRSRLLGRCSGACPSA
jgi:hypothetical protein